MRQRNQYHQRCRDENPQGGAPGSSSSGAGPAWRWLALEVRWKAREVDGGQILQGSEYYWEVPCLELGFRKMNLAPV